jgi:hypothetical protein
MSVCIIDDKEYPITLADTPFVQKWLEIYDNVEFYCIKKFNKDNALELCRLLSKHQKKIFKFGLDFSEINEKTVWNKSLISKIHCQIVAVQKKYKKSTKMLNLNTNNDWNLIHEVLHNFEHQLLRDQIDYSVGNSELMHNPDLQQENFSWEPLLTPQQFYDSSSFDLWHLNVPTAELGRHPHECFCYSPDTWDNEGTMMGQISPRIKAQLSKTYPCPDKGYYEWCKKLGILPVGNSFPLANFEKENIIELIDANTIKIIK